MGPGCRAAPLGSCRRRPGHLSWSREHRRPGGIERSLPGRISRIRNVETRRGPGADPRPGKPTVYANLSETEQRYFNFRLDARLSMPAM
jgi:hypothetical protein